MSSGDRRPYRMRRRAEHMDATRQRIVEAAVALHGSLGPAGTTVLGVAERAGVTRATVYRHFRDEAALFAACSAHWLTGQRPPDPAAWARCADPRARLRTGLADLYRFYRSGEPMLTRIYRDWAVLPEPQRRELLAREHAMRDVLRAAFTAPDALAPSLTAVLGHAVAFSTWRSLCVANGLSNDLAVDLMVELALTAARPGRTDRRASQD